MPAVRAELVSTLTLTPTTGQIGDDGTQNFTNRKGGTYAYHDRHAFNLVGPDEVVDLGPIVNVKVLYARADTAVKIKITTADGTDQILPVEGVLSWQSNTKPITAIKLSGTGAGVLAFAGD